jgi:mercuric ion binding protein
MKKLLGLIASLLIISTSFAQGKKDVQTDTITVKGTCGQCKKRIENAAYIPGVKRAEWNVKTKELVVTYRSSKTSLDKIEQKIADAGHDAGNKKASTEQYQQLPSCCAYNDGHAHDH